MPQSGATMNNNVRLALALPVVAAGFVASRPAARVARDHAPPDCAVWIEGVIPIVAVDTGVRVKYSEPIGDKLTASFPQEAQIDIVRISRVVGDEPMTARLAIRTVRAVAGQWPLTVRGETGQC